MVAPALVAARRAGVPFFWPGVVAEIVFGRLEGVSSMPLQSLVLSVESSSSEASLSRSEPLRLMGTGVVVRFLPPTVEGVLATGRERCVLGVEVGVLPPFRSRHDVTLPPEEAVLTNCFASDLMVRNWNWIPSGVDWPKYLAMSARMNR